jgi:AraC-like DNA-binding protein
MNHLEKANYAWTEDSVRLISTPSSFAKSTLFYVQEVGFFRTLPSYFTERENLDSYLIVYTISGKGTLIYGDKSYALGPRQVFWIDCREHHHYETDPNDLWEMLWVHWNGSTMRGYYEAFMEMGQPLLTLQAGTPVPNLMKELVHIQRDKTVKTELITSKLLVDMMTELLLTSGIAGISKNEAPEYLQEIQRELDQDFQQQMNLDRLADRCAVSKYHLVKQFKRYTGFTPLEYVITCRITHAKELLKYTNLPVSEIATRVGVYNVSHFINLFKARVEETPLVFRKKWQRPE